MCVCHIKKKGRNVIKGTKMLTQTLLHAIAQHSRVQNKNRGFQILPNPMCLEHLQYLSLIRKDRNVREALRQAVVPQNSSNLV